MDFDSALDRINDAPMHDNPFLYLVVDPLFAEDEYAAILEAVPADEDWYNFPDPVTRRRRWQTQTYTFDFRAVELFAQVSAFLESDALLDVLKSKFNYQGHHEDGVTKVVWCRDYDAFSIAPHIDQKEKVFSFLYYLARDGRNPQNGTQILRPRNILFPLHEAMGTAQDDHRQWYDFEKVKDVAFIPNRFVCWNVNATSYHSVDVRFRHDDPHPYRDTIRGFHFSDRTRLPHLFQAS